MQIFGLILAIILYCSILMLLGLCTIYAIRKNHETGERLLVILLFHSFFCFAFLTWMLIIINGSFEVILETSFSFTTLGLSFILFAIWIFTLDFVFRRHLRGKYKTKLQHLSRCFLSPSILILTILNSYVFYLGLYHFFLLNSIR